MLIGVLIEVLIGIRFQIIGEDAQYGPRFRPLEFEDKHLPAALGLL